MRVLIITVYHNPRHGGGAATASSALAEALKRAQYDVKQISRESFCHSYKHNHLFSPETTGTFSANPLGYHDIEVLNEIDKYNPDIVLLGAIDREIISILSINRINKPIIIIFHDLYLVTGGCLFQSDLFPSGETEREYSIYKNFSCRQYFDDCSDCPLIVQPDQKSIAQLNLLLRRKLFAHRKDLTFASVSTWMENILHKIPYLEENAKTLLYNIVDTEIYRPLKDKKAIRCKYNLHHIKKIGLVICHNLNVKDQNDRKGYFLFVESLSQLNLSPAEIEFCSIGAVPTPCWEELHGFTIHHLSYITSKGHL